ncbi:unnamed protein product [Urochloa humidicola]
MPFSIARLRRSRGSGNRSSRRRIHLPRSPLPPPHPPPSSSSATAVRSSFGSLPRQLLIPHLRHAVGAPGLLPGAGVLPGPDHLAITCLDEAPDLKYE